MDFVQQNYPLILIALAILFIAAWVLLRPRQRVTLTDSAPTRPHMMDSRPAEGRGLGGEMAAAASDVTGDILNSPVHRALEDDAAGKDDFCRMKGVGPKLEAALNMQGFYRFQQLAELSPEATMRLDESLGNFKGRVTRDRIVEQASYLARDDRAGFEAAFGKL